MQLYCMCRTCATLSAWSRISDMRWVLRPDERPPESTLLLPRLVRNDVSLSGLPPLDNVRLSEAVRLRRTETGVRALKL